MKNPYPVKTHNYSAARLLSVIMMAMVAPICLAASPTLAQDGLSLGTPTVTGQTTGNVTALGTGSSLDNTPGWLIASNPALTAPSAPQTGGLAFDASKRFAWSLIMQHTRRGSQ